MAGLLGDSAQDADRPGRGAKQQRHGQNNVSRPALNNPSALQVALVVYTCEREKTETGIGNSGNVLKGGVRKGMVVVVMRFSPAMELRS
jgi:hypothetical protein